MADTDLVSLPESIATTVNQVIGAMPIDIPEDRLKRARTRMRIAFLSNRDAIEDCSPASIARCIAASALTGLYPGAPETKPDVWLIPREITVTTAIGKKEKQKQLCWQMGKSSYIRLARRAGHELEPYLAFEGEPLEVDFGTLPAVRHSMRFDIDRSWETLRLGYVIVTQLDSGRRRVGVLTKAEIQKRRRFAETDKVWAAWPLEQCLKTLCNYAGQREMFPLDEGSRLALSADTITDTGMELSAGPVPVAEQATEISAETPQTPDIVAWARQQFQLKLVEINAILWDSDILNRKATAIELPAEHFDDARAAIGLAMAAEERSSAE
jgi:recombinational DNA repair protein RecT